MYSFMINQTIFSINTVSSPEGRRETPATQPHQTLAAAFLLRDGGHPYMAASVARAFFDGIVRLHGFPSSIVSDRDPVFTGHVWRDLFGLAGVKLRMSTAFHPQTDGQSEVVNKIIAMYLRCITGDRPRAWVDWLAWAEYCYNTSYHSALHATPFEVVYGRPPPAMLPYAPGTAY